MVNDMYKETAKAGKNPMIFILIWALFIYVFYIAWGIGEILLEIKTPFLLKHMILFGITAVLGWAIIFKFLVEYDFIARKHEFTATKRLSKKSQVVCTIKYNSIVLICTDEEKDKLKNYRFAKKQNFVRAYQGGQKMHIAYNFNSELQLVTLKISRNMLNTIKENMAKEKEENI